MKTLAELKRTIKPGMRLTVIRHDYRPELAGTVRTVTDVQGNGYFYRTDGDERRAWSGYAKASCFSFPEPDTYRQDEGVKCSCGQSSSPGAVKHSDYCNIKTGKRMAWTIQLLAVERES